MQVDLRVPVPVNASMKALPKRKGNGGGARLRRRSLSASMKALPKRKGNVNIRHRMSITSALPQ